MDNTTEKKKRSLSLAPARKISTGFMTRIVDATMLENFAKLHEGGRIFISVKQGVDDDGEAIEYAFLEFVNKESVDAYNAKKGSNTFHGSKSKGRARKAVEEDI